MRQPAWTSTRQPLISRAMKAGLMAEQEKNGNDEPRGRSVTKLVMSLIFYRMEQNDPFFPIDCSIHHFPQPALAPGIRSPCRGRCARHRGRCHPSRGAAPMTAPGMWFSPPRAAIAALATSSLPGCGQPRLVGGRRQGLRHGQPWRLGCRQRVGRRFQGERRRPACRHQRRRIMARHHFRRSVQRHLAGDARLIFVVPEPRWLANLLSRARRG